MPNSLRAAAAAIRLGLQAAITVCGGIGLFHMLGLTAGHFDVTQLAFFTILSNLLVFGVYAVLLVSALWRSLAARALAPGISFSPVFMGAVMLSIVVTGLVYNLLLARTLDGALAGAYGQALGNTMLHRVVPALVFLEWFLFADVRRLRWWAPLAWAALPLAYCVFAFIRAQVGGPLMGGSYYPYPFLDVDSLGWPAVLLNLAALTAAFLALAWALIWLARLPRRLGAARLGS